MAFCPKCKGTMDTTEIVCPHCGFDFPPTSDWQPNDSRDSFVWSPLAEMALTISSVAAVFGAFGSVIISLNALAQGNLIAGLLVGPITFFLQLCMLVVFLRVQK